MTRPLRIRLLDEQRVGAVEQGDGHAAGVAAGRRHLPPAREAHLAEPADRHVAEQLDGRVEQAGHQRGGGLLRMGLVAGDVLQPRRQPALAAAEQVVVVALRIDALAERDQDAAAALAGSWRPPPAAPRTAWPRSTGSARAAGCSAPCPPGAFRASASNSLDRATRGPARPGVRSRAGDRASRRKSVPRCFGVRASRRRPPAAPAGRAAPRRRTPAGCRRAGGP